MTRTHVASLHPARPGVCQDEDSPVTEEAGTRSDVQCLEWLSAGAQRV